MNNESKALELAHKSRGLCEKLRRTPTALADLIPHLQATADEAERQHAEIESLRAQLAQRVPDADEMAQQIRWVNGANKMGAGALAENLCDWIASRISAAPSQQAPQPEQPAPRDHVTSPDCWCNPELNYVDPETGCAVYVHKEPQ